MAMNSLFSSNLKKEVKKDSIKLVDRNMGDAEFRTRYSER